MLFERRVAQHSGYRLRAGSRSPHCSFEPDRLAIEASINLAYREYSFLLDTLIVEAQNPTQRFGTPALSCPVPGF
jgi:hypothetical protein